MFVNNTARVGAAGYTVTKSLRFKSSAYMTRTFGTPTNQKVWTFSTWCKIGDISAVQRRIFGAYTVIPNDGGILLDANGHLYVYNYTPAIALISTAVLCDPSAWYHVVVVMDTTQVVAADRVKIYLNGAQVTSFSTATYPAQNSVPFINAATYSHDIARSSGGATPWNGYLAEVNFIDGQALNAVSFGETSATTGQWVPKAYSGSYGTNGFYLPFTDTTSTTTLAYDASGNANHWTPTNVSLTAGVTYDSMTDTPTNNYAVLNLLSGYGSGVVQSANLDLNSGVAWNSCMVTLPLVTGKWYAEVTGGVSGSAYVGIGLRPLSLGNVVAGEYAGSAAGTYGGNITNTQLSTYAAGVAGSTMANSATTMRVAVDVSAGKVWFGTTTGWLGGGDPASGTTPTYTFSAAMALYFSAYALIASANMGQRAFVVTPPTGFLSLCTANLPVPVIAKGNQHFDIIGSRAGTGATGSVTSLAFQPDLVWIKERGAVMSHVLTNSVVGSTKYLSSDQGAAETTDATTLTSFLSNGYSFGTSAGINASAHTYVDWVWKAGGTVVSNTNGSLTSQVSANPTAGFSIVTYTGTGVAATVGHGLGIAPSLILVKNRINGAVSWGVYHNTIGATGGVYLNLTDTTNTSAVFWNNTAPTSSVFAVGTWNGVNGNTHSHVAYCFAEVPGFSKFGSYTGNGSADGSFVFCGFRPKYVMFKRTDAVSNWDVLDTARSVSNMAGDHLAPNSAAAEVVSAEVDILSNGFKLRTTGTTLNASGGTYIYAAFAEVPTKYANAR